MEIWGRAGRRGRPARPQNISSRSEGLGEGAPFPPVYSRWIPTTLRETSGYPIWRDDFVHIA